MRGGVRHSAGRMFEKVWETFHKGDGSCIEMSKQNLLNWKTGQASQAEEQQV